MPGVMVVAALAGTAGLVQAIAGLVGRRALLAGVSAPALVLSWGLGLALAAAPWWIAGGARLLPDPWWLAPATGFLLLAGNACLAWALTHGDASLVVPVLSGKVVLVAVLMALVGSHLLPAAWVGAALTCAGIVVIGSSMRQSGQNGGQQAGRTIALALAAAACYAGFDALFVCFGAHAGLAGMLPAATCWALIGALPLLVVARPPTAGRLPLATSGLLTGLQCTALVAAIILAGDAVLPNVLYGCRGIWSVALAALLARTTPGLGPTPWGRRFAGAGLIAVAVGFVVVGRGP